MDTITLTDAQRDKVIDELATEMYEDFGIEIELSDTLTIEAKGYVYTEGYYEDDYYNGTGAWIETYRSGHVELKAIVYDEDANTATEYKVDKLTEQAARDLLNELRS